MQTHNTNVFDDSYLAPSYNVAPQSLQPVVRLSPDTRERELAAMRWGLVSSWALAGLMVDYFEDGGSDLSRKAFEFEALQDRT